MAFDDDPDFNDEVRKINAIWTALSTHDKALVAAQYVSNLGNRDGMSWDIWCDAMKPALQMYGHLPPEYPTASGAEEYEEIMKIQDSLDLANLQG